MRYLLAALAFVLLASTGASAGIFYWTDDDGVINVTDSMDNVPPEYKDRAKETGPEPLQVIVPLTPAPVEKRPGEQPARPKEEAGEYYGGQPLAWWRGTFLKNARETQNAEGEKAWKEQFIGIFEKGRRQGQIYGETEITAYEQYKRDIPEIDKRIKRLLDEREELRRKARYYGVPRGVRGE